MSIVEIKKFCVRVCKIKLKKKSLHYRIIQNFILFFLVEYQFVQLNKNQ